jgi:hypothetical protein
MACSKCEVIGVTCSDAVTILCLHVFVNANLNVVERLQINLRQAGIGTSTTTLNERLRNMGPIASTGVMRIIDHSRRLGQIRPT